MKNGIETLCATLFLGLALVGAGCGGRQEPTAAADIEALRAQLREQVANGELSEEQAQVRLALARKEAKFKTKTKTKDGQSPALKALGAELNEQVQKGTLSADEAKARFAAEKQKEERKTADKKAGAKD